jgi:hypothetical protein
MISIVSGEERVQSGKFMKCRRFKENVPLTNGSILS